MKQPSEAELKKKIDELVNETLHGSSFWNKFDKKVKESMENHKNDSESEEEGSYGVYVKNNAKKGKKAPSTKPVVQVEDKKKRGRPVTKKKRTFDPESATARRANKVKEVREKYGLTMIEASKKIKADKIPY